MPNSSLCQDLCIKQQNCKHSKDITLTLINTANPAEWDIILIQEPYIYPNSRLTPASNKWIPLYPVPTSNIDEPPRSIIFVNANISSDAFQQIPINCNEISAVSVNHTAGTLNIFNIY
ncbi:hypothetical protein K439DRAFT_1360128, partial [Ramaria rubella]